MICDMSNKDDDLARALAGLARGVEALMGRMVELGGRVEALEAAKADTERRAEIVQAAQRSWRPLLRVQGDLLLASEAGETCRVPLSVARTLAAGRPLDLDVIQQGDEARLVDHAGRVVARLPGAALLALPRVLSGQDARGMLELGVRFRAVRESGTSPARSPAIDAKPRRGPSAGVPGSPESVLDNARESDRHSGAVREQSGSSPGPVRASPAVRS